jgi:exonuclease SbcD
LPYSFSENHTKSVLLVDMVADGACEVREVPIPVGRPVLTLTGSIDELLHGRPDARAAGSLVRAVLTDPGVVLDAKQRLAQVYPYVVEIVLAPPTLPLGTSADPVDRRSHTPEQVVDRFWLDAVGVEPTDAERSWLHGALVAARQDGA